MAISKQKKQARKQKKQKEKAYGEKQKRANEKKKFREHVKAMMDKIITPEHESYEILSKGCDPYENYGDAKQHIEDMTEVLNTTRFGVGLAAPQIGIQKRALVWKKTPNSAIEYMINPVVLSSNDETQSMYEGCLSYPGWVAEIERPTEIEMSWYDLDATAHTSKFTGWQARILLHEIDHLAGICKVGAAPEESRKYSK